MEGFPGPGQRGEHGREARVWRESSKTRDHRAALDAHERLALRAARHTSADQEDPALLRARHALRLLHRAPHPRVDAPRLLEGPARRRGLRGPERRLPVPGVRPAGPLGGDLPHQGALRGPAQRHGRVLHDGQLRPHQRRQRRRPGGPRAGEHGRRHDEGRNARVAARPAPRRELVHLAAGVGRLGGAEQAARGEAVELPGPLEDGGL
mmetsp:Transcript_38198/g.107985  ORF Transcript_38198/g.107985 Transcript_38198/m.107985 type:complete len:208 (-) Transcript_38198:757-1380(-)